MATVTLHDKNFRPFISQEQIQERVQELAAQISAEYAGRTPLVVPVLNGAFLFAADLLRALTIPARVSFIKVASYELTESKGEVEELLGLTEDLNGLDIIIVEDIVDTGLTMQEVVRAIREMGPRSVVLATLLHKPASMKAHGLEINYCGFTIGPEFVVGYGMDYNSLGRNLPEIFVLDEA